MRIKPIHGMLLVPFFVAAVLVAEYALDGGFSHQGFERVTPGQDGVVEIAVDSLPAGDIRYYRFLNRANQEARFFVARDRDGVLQVAFDANEACYKLKRGYRHEGDWVVCNKCDKAFRVAEINAGGGGCKPVPLAHRLDGETLVLTETDILRGWRYFR